MPTHGRYRWHRQVGRETSRIPPGGAGFTGLRVGWVSGSGGSPGRVGLLVGWVLRVGWVSRRSRRNPPPYGGLRLASSADPPYRILRAGGLRLASSADPPYRILRAGGLRLASSADPPTEDSGQVGCASHARLTHPTEDAHTPTPGTHWLAWVTRNVCGARINRSRRRDSPILRSGLSKSSRRRGVLPLEPSSRHTEVFRQSRRISRIPVSPLSEGVAGF